MTIYPKCDHTLYGVLITKTKTLSNTFALISIGFYFSFSSFLSWALDHLVVVTMIITCSITWHVPTSLSLHTLSIEVSTRVSLIIQNQTRAFQVIYCQQPCYRRQCTQLPMLQPLLSEPSLPRAVAAWERGGGVTERTYPLATELAKVSREFWQPDGTHRNNDTFRLRDISTKLSARYIQVPLSFT